MITQFLSDRDDSWFISKINFSGGLVQPNFNLQSQHTQWHLGKAVEGPERNRTRKSFLTYISCVVHKNAAFATFRGDVFFLDSKMCGECDLGGDQQSSRWSSGSHGNAGPSPPPSFCIAREDGGLQGSCSCVPGPGAEVMAR